MAQRRTKAKARVKRATASSEPLVNEFAARHGRYEQTTVVDLSGELGGRRNSMVKVMLNRGGTAVDRWMADGGSTLFEEPQRAAIKHCLALWARVDGLAAINLGNDRILAPLGWSQQEALTELHGYQKRLPPLYWQLFENVVRWDQPVGVVGSSIATNRTSAIDRTKVAVAFVASMIAMWRGM